MKKEKIVAVRGNLKGFIINVEKHFEGVAFEDNFKMYEEFEEYVKENITDYVYCESVNVDEK